MLTVSDFEKLSDIPAVIILELPYRPLGGELPTWDSLLEIKAWATKNNVIMHLDGARIWETKLFYQKDYNEICSLFDSVYVSFYKGLGGITGAILAGSNSFIDTAKIWQKRYGGNLYSLSPYILSARLSLSKNLEKIDKFVLRTQELAKIFANYSKILIHPNPPQTNMFLMYINEKADILNTRNIELMNNYKTSIFPYFIDSNIPGFVKTEMHFFENALNFDNDLLIQMLDDLFS